MKRVSDQIADWLACHGIERVFAVTGGGAMFLNQSFGRHDGLHCVFMHHEQACAMAAEGYARIAGKPAVVMVTTGPGSINALNGVFGAFTDSIPMIVISGQVKSETCLSFYDHTNLRQLGDQEGPIIKMVTPISKYARLIRNATDLVEFLPQAYKIAISGRPGPVWLDIPINIQSSTEVIDIPNAIYVKPYSEPIIHEKLLILIKQLKSANRPLILGGTGVRLSGSVDLLLRIIEKTGIPLATAWTHDLIPSKHQLFAGRPGTIGTRGGNFCLQNADLVLVLGSRLNIRQTSYNWGSFAKNAWISQVDIDPSELNKPTIKANQSITADIEQFLMLLEKYLTKNSLPDYSAWGKWCRSINSKYHVTKEHYQNKDKPLNPYLVVERVFDLLRDDDIVVCGNASACILPFQIGSIKKGQRLFSNSGSASMGYDLPAAIGAAASIEHANHSRVICFAGDGSLQMNIQELQTLRDSDFNVIIIVLNNGGYLSIKQTHSNFFGHVIGATPESGINFPDFSKVAKAYGVESLTIITENDLDKLDKALYKDGPLVIEIKVDSQQEFAPKIQSRVGDDGMFFTPELDDMYPFIDKKIIREIRESAKLVQAI
jgi:acetolactate synthase I/II/III large subunit